MFRPDRTGHHQQVEYSSTIRLYTSLPTGATPFEHSANATVPCVLGQESARLFTATDIFLVDGINIQADRSIAFGCHLRSPFIDFPRQPHLFNIGVDVALQSGGTAAQGLRFWPFFARSSAAATSHKVINLHYPKPMGSSAANGFSCSRTLIVHPDHGSTPVNDRELVTGFVIHNPSSTNFTANYAVGATVSLFAWTKDTLVFDPTK